MVLVFFIYSLYFIVEPILGNDEKEQLVFVYTHFRHGARGPFYNLTLNGIDYFGEQWTNPQDLTAVGMRMHYTLGIRNRKRYQGLLSKTFDPREVIVKSTNFNRTIQSAYSQLQGLYLPLENEDINTTIEERIIQLNNYNKHLQEFINNCTLNETVVHYSLPNKMQIFPIHIYNTIERKFLLHTIVNVSGCEGVMPIREENRNSKEYQKIIDDFVSQEGDKMKDYFKMTHPEFNYTNGAELFNICDHFICDLYDGRLQKESIISETFNKSCQTYLSNLLLIEEFGDKSQTVLNMSMSPVFEELFYYMDNSIVNDMKNKGKETLGTYTPKLVMISGHDVSMLGMMGYLKRVFNINNPILVPFASSLSFEVYRKGKSRTTKDYQVNYYINDENIGNFSYEQFFSPEYIRGKLKSEDEVANFCQFSDWKEEQHINVLLYIFLGLSVLLVVLVITLIIIIVITKVKIKRRNALTSDDTNDNLIPPENK